MRHFYAMDFFSFIFKWMRVWLIVSLQIGSSTWIRREMDANLYFWKKDSAFFEKVRFWATFKIELRTCLPRMSEQNHVGFRIFRFFSKVKIFGIQYKWQGCQKVYFLLQAPDYLEDKRNIQNESQLDETFFTLAKTRFFTVFLAFTRISDSVRLGKLISCFVFCLRKIIVLFVWCIGKLERDIEKLSIR